MAASSPLLPLLFFSFFLLSHSLLPTESSLTSLTHRRLLNLKHNRFNGHIPINDFPGYRFYSEIVIPESKSLNQIKNLIIILAILNSGVMIRAIVSFLRYFWFRLKYSAEFKGEGIREKLLEERGLGPLSSKQKGSQEVVCFEGIGKFDLKCLMKSPAQVMGKGEFSEAYKAFLEDGM